MVNGTGLSNFRKMCVTVMTMYYNKQKPSIVHYRKFQNFCNDTFTEDVKTATPKSHSEENVSFKTLKESVNVTLNRH